MAGKKGPLIDLRKLKYSMSLHTTADTAIVFTWVEGHLNPEPLNPRLFNYETLNLPHGIEKLMVEWSGFDNSGVEMSVVEAWA